MNRLLLGLSAALLLPACGDGSSDGGPSRPYRMGFTPWLYDATNEARDWTFERIGAEGDIVSQHMEEGVPWPEMLAGEAISGTYLAEISGRLDKKPAGQRVLLQINPLNTSRTGLADYRGASTNMALPAPWNGDALDHPDVKTAYLNYALRMVELFQPDFLGIGIEVNLLIRNAPSLWPRYVALHRHVYAELKRLHPTLTVFASFFCVPFFPEWSSEDDGDAQRAGLADLIDHVDLVAFSVHPFMSALLAESFPDGYFDRLFALSSKPVAVAESSYPAQAWSTSTPPVLTFNGTPSKQDAFLRSMLDACGRYGARFVVWFAIRDYDALWAGVLGSSELALVWRDTGLYAEDGAERPALATWRAALAR